MFLKKTTSKALTSWQHRAGDYAVELLGIEDPYLTEKVGPHASPEFQAGLERLLSFDVRIRNLSRSEDKSIVLGWFRLQDSEGYNHDCLGLDMRMKDPRLLEGVLPPEGAARGWLTFTLPRDRHAERLVFFSGYLAGKTAVFELPRMTPEEWEAHYDDAKRAWANRQIAQELAVRDARVREQELRAAALAENAERMRELERREAALEN